MKSGHESDVRVSSASPVSCEPKPIDHYMHQQPVSVSKLKEHHRSVSEWKRESYNIALTECDPRMSHHQLASSKPLQGGICRIPHGHSSKTRHRSDSGKPIYSECMPSSHGCNTHLSAAQILQDLPRERPVSPVHVRGHNVTSSELESVHREHSLDVINRIPKHSELEHHSVFSLHHKKELSDMYHSYRPTSLRLSTVTVSDQCEVPPSEVVPTTAVHSDRQQNEMKISWRGSKRIAHKSDREIKTQRQVIEHKLTPVSPTSQQLTPKNLRKGTTTGSSRDIRTELMKRMSKK